MAVLSEIGRGFRANGGWWVVVQFALFIVAYLIPVRYGQDWPPLQHGVVTGAGLLLLVFGVIQFAAGAVTLGRGLTPFPRPMETTVLRTHGVYGLVRHPIYTGVLAMAIGWSLYQQSLAGLGFDVVLFIFFDRKAAREERWLIEKFPDYAQYRKRVKRLIPGIY